MKKTILCFSLSLLFYYSGISAQELQWHIEGMMPKPVAGGSAIAVPPYIYIIGGYSKDLQKPVNWIQRFNPDNGIWDIVDSMDVPRYGLLADNVGETLYYFGGANDTSTGITKIERWRLNESSVIKTLVSNEAFNRSFPVGGIFEDKFYFFGGTSYQFTDSVEVPYVSVFDISSGDIVDEIDGLFSPYNLPQQQMGVFKEDYFYIFGGVTNGIQNKIYKFDTTTNDFTVLPASMVSPLAGAASVYSEELHAIVLAGGYDENYSALSSSNLYFIEDTSVIIEEGPPLNFERKNLMAVEYGEVIYAFGGFDLNGEVVSYIEVLSDVSTTAANIEDDKIISEYRLQQNYPNPFNPTTTIEFSLEKNTEVKIDVVNLLGQHIITLENSYKSAGDYRVNWNGNDESGNAVAGGIYFYTFKTPGSLITKKMTLLK